MLHPPLEVCIERAEARLIPDIGYDIDTKMVETYWNEAVFIEGETVFQDPLESSEQIADSIVEVLPR